VNGNGLALMAYGAIVTLVPLLTVGLVGLWLTRANYLSVCGILAGRRARPSDEAGCGFASQHGSVFGEDEDRDSARVVARKLASDLRGVSLGCLQTRKFFAVVITDRGVFDFAVKK